jgi:hypothetical protein
MAEKKLPVAEGVEEVQEENPVVDGGGEPEGIAAATQEVKTVEELEKELERVKNECRIDKLKFILSQDSVSDACIANQVKKVMKLPKMCVDFVGDAEDDLCRYTFEADDGIEYTEDGVKFTGDKAMNIKPPVNINGQSFSVETEFRVDQVQSPNWVVGDPHVRGSNESFHLGFRDNGKFGISFWHDHVDFPISQVAGKWYKVKFEFNAKTKIGTLSVNGQQFRHKFNGTYDDAISLIGRGHNPKVARVTVKRVCIN